MRTILRVIVCSAIGIGCMIVAGCAASQASSYRSLNTRTLVASPPANPRLTKAFEIDRPPAALADSRAGTP